ncbi:LOW QUALITY PROTEIN: uncharacterized protein LOC124290730 [Haliotis rubra]|uniref:LOW QUALITY PROTEIN: uncharacterized protein LOC124290730 n=1 Tax=Haliotis rubra TaxID=36100 RepID=UPI001EE61167|nr:LOW QUALITY PROTEIN: uncharacterized protein LOC124290730 [Haliotis rubra]
MTSNEQVIKTVAKKLKYYFDVKRLEDGFDLSGSQNPVLDHPPMKARSILQQYGGSHDRPLKHYFSSNDVRVNLTQMRRRPSSSGPHERHVKHRLKKYMSNYSYQLSGPDLPPVVEKQRRAKSSRKFKKSQQVELLSVCFLSCFTVFHFLSSSSINFVQFGFIQCLPFAVVRTHGPVPLSDHGIKNSNLPEYYYIYSGSSKCLRPEPAGVPFKSPKKKPLKGGMPALRTVPSNTVSRGEAERLVNAATKLLVATESVEQSNVPKNSRQTAPRPFEGSLLEYYLSTQPQTSYAGFPGVPTIDEEEARLLLHSRRQPSKTGKRPATAKYTWDIHGRRVAQEEPKAYDDSFLGKGLRPHSSHPSSRPTSKRVYRHLRSPTPSDTVSSRSSVTHTTSTSDIDRLPPASRQRRKKSSRHATIINVPEVKLSEGVSVQDTTQTAGTQDEIGIQTENRLIKDYDQQEDEVKQGPWGEYQIYVRTGNTIGASTKADIKLTLYGQQGRTKEMLLGMGDSKNHKVAFQKNKEDLFILAAHHVGRLRKIKIGHDRVELSNAWFLDSVSVYDMHDKRIYEFPCNQWLSEHDGDRHTYRVLPMDRDRAFIDALESPGASNNKSRNHPETSEDESDQIVVKHGRESVKAHNSKAGDKSDRSYTGSEDSSSEFESESDADETAVVSPKDQKDKRSRPKTYKEEDRSKSGPTFTFRTKKSKTPATRRQTEEKSVDEDTNTTKEEFLAGYKAGISAASAESQKQAEEERAQELELMQGETVHDAARRGHLDRLKELLHHFPDLKDAKDETGWTPLLILTHMMDLMEKRCAQERTLHDASPAKEKNEAFTYLMKDDDVDTITLPPIDPVSDVPEDLDAAFRKATKFQSPNIPQFNAKSRNTLRCVTTSAVVADLQHGGYLECVKWLVANRARIDAEDSFKRTALTMANDRGKTEVAEFLSACLRELKNPHSSFAQMHAANQGSGERSDRDIDSSWRDDKGSSVSQDAAAGSDDESSIAVKRVSSPELKEKKRLYNEQHHKMEERGLSFLDSIRQDLDS